MDAKDTKFNAGREMRKHWQLQEEACFLNHGSFGATPIRVLEAQQRWQRHMERQPVSFFVRELPGLLREAAAQLASFLGSNQEQLAFVENATAGVNAVLRSFPWQHGDELLLSEHAYPAVKHAALYVARQSGVDVREYAVPFPLQSTSRIVEAFQQAITPKTRLAIIDHVSSPLAVIYPVQELLALCRQHGIPSLVDGAHAPGMLPLQLAQLDSDWYIGNCHKWLFAPKGCAFLHAAARAQAHLQPTVISLRAEDKFPANFDWTGTRDVSAWLAISEALTFYAEIGGGDLPQRLHGMAIDMAELVAGQWGVQLPAMPSNFGAMVTLPVPVDIWVTQAEANVWRDRLWDTHKIEVPFFALHNRLWLRISTQLYNTEGEYRKLATAILEMVESMSPS